ncbi:hypothetical protein EJ06DRAFT_279064 [Trichodelitschia bisporula]|uniref:Uncharacterized protein n=1 Tax=Trichodelitschia bisporula TaxID=703511 RepID=A0A6G1I588_9PEZI|nr:hypothetical protein EJ06DRAFT_279064 [Trichodelitschia bisporula]
MASTSWTWDESYGQHRMWAHQEQRWVLADGTRLPRAPLRGNGSQSVVASTSRKPYTEVASTSREPYTQVASTSRVPYTPVDTQRQDISDAVLATDQPSDDFGTTAFQPPQHTYSASPYASTSEVPYTPADTQGQAISTAALASDQPSYDFGATASQTPQHGYAASPYAQAAVQSSGPGTSQRVMTPEQEAEWATRASSSVNPKVAVITKDPGAEYMVYAIHGLQSNTRTWGGYKKGKPNGSLRWLDHLSEWLKGHGGAAVDVSLVGWNTQAQSTANIASDVRSAVRSLANTIVGLRGETPVRVIPSRSTKGTACSASRKKSSSSATAWAAS